MDLPVYLQLRQAASSFAAGIAAALVYDVLAVLRLGARLRVLPDIAFCAFLAAMYFFLGLEVGDGGLRIFMLVFIFLGMWAYFGLSRGKVRRLFCKIFTIIIKTANIIKKPVKKILVMLKKYGKILKKLFKNLWERCILYNKNGSLESNEKNTRKSPRKNRVYR